MELPDAASTSTATKTESAADLPSVSPQKPAKDSDGPEGDKLSPASTLNKPPGETLARLVRPEVASEVIRVQPSVTNEDNSAAQHVVIQRAVRGGITCPQLHESGVQPWGGSAGERA